MMKFVVIAIALAVICRMLFRAWPWELWRRSERSQQRAQARSLLGVSRSATREEIVAAHRRLMYDAHPDRGGTAGKVHEIDAARDLLLEHKGGETR
ncbi:molecular chaperone DnaJ [Croceicoccus sp. YJ47]|uniref:molecular chaperone DnaJ n=1 Tax=Croceicoccus sp. YJ47 TaxID=2798724 RepID=UPI001920E7E7|nr:molecular chaperone DnaJ [Croceicoccus sp. YJ47]QQN73365.1 molecular chaperone DnaJ [Croceicoccus sp. YJ47]